MLQKLKEFKWGYVLLALLFTLVGVLFIAFQGALTHLAVALGIILLVFGIGYAVLTISNTGRGVNFFFKIVFAVTAIICAIIVLVMRESAVDTISSVMALLLIIDASFKLHTAAMSKRYALFGWWFMVAVSTLTVIGAFITIKYIRPNDPALPIVLGLTLIIDAIGNFFSAFFVSGYEKRLSESIYYNTQNEPSPDPFPIEDPIFEAETEDTRNNV